MGVDYRVLGRLEVARDGAPVDLGAYRQRALLALLMVHANTVLSTDRILEELWGSSAAADKQSSLWVYVSGLRTALEPQRAKRSEGTILLTRPPGYVLSVATEATDAGRFANAVAEARRVTENDPTSAAHTLRDALATWRGHAYEEFTYESWAEPEIARLEELRLEAIELRVDADLRLGLSRELVSELHGLVRLHPLRERLVRSLMLALYRSGRAAEALRAASSLRRRLVEDLGVEPSRALRDLEQQILVDDGSLLVDRRAASGGPRAGLNVRGYELRDELGRGAFGTVFRAYQPVVGREVAIKVIAPELADEPAFIRRFDAEAQLIARLEHPHIVPLYDYWREPGAAYLVMRLITGGTLGDALARGALSPARAATMFGQLTGALAAAHRSRVIHGDVKPENILIDGDGNAYLSDFGVAVAVGADGHVGTDGESTLAPYVSPERLAGRALGPSSDVYSLAVVAANALAGITGEYEQVRGALPTATRTVLDRATATDPARRFPDASSFGRALIDALGEPAVAVPDHAATNIDNPYKGLRAFGVADTGEFFGRERLVARLVSRLGAPGARGRFVAVVGPSGSGKSSAVRAGLLPAIAAGALPCSQEWFLAGMTPAPHPFEELEAALLRISTDTPHDLLETLFSPGGLRRAVHRLLPDDDSQLLLVIDQFEELYTQVDDDTATRFVDELVDLVTAPGTRVRVVVTLRADFYDRPLRHRSLGELVREGTEVVTPMSVEELEAAITGPAGTVGVDVDQRVVAEIVGEVVDRPGALPLLQYTMTELFEARAGGRITTAAYRAGGGVTRMLARRADALLAGLPADVVEIARQVFIRLIAIDDDGGTVSRRRALVADLEELDRRGAVRRVLDTFERHRLLTFDRDPVTRGPTVEISHEALLVEWATLRDWVDAARDDLRAHRHLVAEMGAWITAERSADYLLRGGRLDAIVAWADTTTLELRPTEREYLDASIGARDADQRVRDEEGRRTAAAERRARRRTREFAAAAIVAACVAVLAGFAWVQREDAREARGDLIGTREAHRLANQSLTALERDPALSLLLAVEALRATADLGYAVPEAIDATHWALQELGVQYEVAADTPTEIRSGPRGAQGVWVLPVDDLVDHAVASAPRGFTETECDRYFADGCPVPTSSANVEYLGGVPAYASAPKTGRTQVVVGIPGGLLDPVHEEWQANLEYVAGRSTIDVRLQPLPSPTDALTEGMDVDVVFLGPSDLPELAAAQRLVDLRAFLDEAALVDDYGRHLVSLTRVGEDGTWPSDTGPVHGVMVSADSKTVMWTNEPEFTDAGYVAPTDWDSLMSLARTMVADGRTPFCVGIESGDADGWPATDWVEVAVLRSAGREFYDRWIRHDVPFDDPVVVEAIRSIGEMVLTPGFLDTTPAEASLRNFEFAWHDFVDGSAECMMAPFPSYMPAISGTTRSLGSFEFPGVSAAYGDMVVGGGTFAVPVTDRPEVRALMAAFASPDWGAGTARRQTLLALPANARFDVTTMANPAIAGVTTAIHEAISADAFRMDGSDAMPEQIGFGAFWDGMVRLFQEGTLENLDALAADIAGDIEAAWTQLEPGG